MSVGLQLEPSRRAEIAFGPTSLRRNPPVVAALVEVREDQLRGGRPAVIDQVVEIRIRGHHDVRREGLLTERPDHPDLALTSAYVPELGRLRFDRLGDRGQRLGTVEPAFGIDGDVRVRGEGDSPLRRRHLGGAFEDRQDRGAVRRGRHPEARRTALRRGRKTRRRDPDGDLHVHRAASLGVGRTAQLTVHEDDGRAPVVGCNLLLRIADDHERVLAQPQLVGRIERDRRHGALEGLDRIAACQGQAGARVHPRDGIRRLALHAALHKRHRRDEIAPRAAPDVFEAHRAPVVRGHAHRGEQIAELGPRREAREEDDREDTEADEDEHHRGQDLD
jgi:hypothetical protein